VSFCSGRILYTQKLILTQGETIRLLVWILSFMAFGYATGEFEVTAERLGVYRPEEHIGKFLVKCSMMEKVNNIYRQSCKELDLHKLELETNNIAERLCRRSRWSKI